MNELIKYKRPAILRSTTHRSKCACGNIYVTITVDDTGNPVEMFLCKGHAGSCTWSFIVIISRLVSTAWRYGVSPEEILKQVSGEKCSESIHQAPVLLSCGDAIAKAIVRVLEERDAELERSLGRRDAEEKAKAGDVLQIQAVHQRRENKIANADELPFQSQRQARAFGRGFV